MSFPKMFVEIEGNVVKFFPKQIDRDNRLFVGEIERLLTSEEAETWKNERGWAPVPGRAYLAPVVVAFEQVKSVNVEAARMFRLSEPDFKIYSDGLDPDRKMDTYRNAMKSWK